MRKPQDYEAALMALDDKARLLRQRKVVQLGGLVIACKADAVPVEDGEMPVFWACGVTPQAAIAAVKTPFAITHAPGAMLVTDLKNAQLSV